MSYAIIRNEKYTKDQMIKLSPHNERVKKEYSNKNIDVSKTHLNYHLKKPKENNYFKEFKRLKEENNLKGQLHKNSIYACEMIITSDNSFFKNIGIKETQRYFKSSYDFICNYENLGKENIISAVIHLDEETPHMHLVFIPVVNSKDKNGNLIRKIGGNDFWKEKNSYMKLQDSFYEYIKSKGFNLERGKSNPNRKYKSVEELKEITNFYDTKKLEKKLPNNSSAKYITMKDFLNNEQFTQKSVEKNLLEPLVQENIRLIKEINNLKLQLSKIKNITENYADIQKENQLLQITLNSKEKEIDIMYDLIAKLNKEKEQLITEAKKYNINLENSKNFTMFA